MRRDLSNKQYVYWWVNGIHFGVRLEAANQCILVIIGTTAEGKKELVVLVDGFRESEQSWKEVLLDLKRRGFTGIGFWKALPQVFGETRVQRCWMHRAPMC
ncbi:Transposase, Mutator family [Nitrosospira sp. Nsp1]|nr:Transposase, Mutator family [Nitrosospira sp. Nsp1]